MRHLDLNIDNSTLVEECRGGDREAMSILYTRFAPRMLHVISRYVPDRDSANDILHDGFIAAFTRLETLREPERIDFWLASIMKNLSLKFLQAQSVTSLLEEIPETMEEPDIDQILDFATLEALIRQLPEGYQKVFRLAVLENKSHKEISEILGIAPNSSSSQLFHAKLRLRQIIKDYQLRAGLISLLLLLSSAAILFFTRRPDAVSSSAPLSTEARPERQDGSHIKESEPTEAIYASIRKKVAIATANSNVSADIAPADEASPKSIYGSDSIFMEETSPLIDNVNQSTNFLKDDIDDFQDQLFADIPNKAAAAERWSAAISVDPGMMNFNIANNDDLSDASHNNPWNDPDRPPSENEDYQKELKSLSRMPEALQSMESYLAPATRRHHLPISFAVTAEKHFTSWLGCESGIGYSFLHTDFERYHIKGNEVSTCYWHYLEIPLKLNLYAYTSPNFKLYGSLGGRLAIPVYSYARIAPESNCSSGRFGSSPVWSVGASIGVAFRMSKRLDLFIEPSIRYHFPQDCAIPNIWTDDEPWSLSIPLGIRFSW